MDLSIWSGYLDQMDIYTMVDTFAVHGWEALEMSNEHAHELLLQEGTPYEIGRRFRAYAADRGIKFPQGHFYLTEGIRIMRNGVRQGTEWSDTAPPTDDELAQVLVKMKRWIDLFDGLGITAGVLHLGGVMLPRLGWSDHRMFDRRVHALTLIAELAQDTPVIICIENTPHDRCGAQNWEQLLPLIHAVGAKNVGICLDTGHANMIGVDPVQFLVEVKDHLRALHITDNLGSNDDHMLPYGKGNIPWEAFLQELGSIDYHGAFNFEIPGEIMTSRGSFDAPGRQPLEILLMKLDYIHEVGKWMIAQTNKGQKRV